jgi:hypothetical protein
MAEPLDLMLSALNLDKKRPALDIVFLVDASKSMASCIDALVGNDSIFVESLNATDPLGNLLIKDWRIRVVGYREQNCDGAQRSAANPFSTAAGEVKSQFTALKSIVGGDKPGALLDAMHQISQWASAEKAAPPSNLGWRHRHDAARVVVIFTDAGCKNTFTTSDGSEGTVDDLIRALHASKLEVHLLAPEALVYFDLAAMDGLKWEPVGEHGSKPQQSLVDFIADARNCRKVMEECIRSACRAKAIEEPATL